MLKVEYISLKENECHEKLVYVVENEYVPCKGNILWLYAMKAYM